MGAKWTWRIGMEEQAKSSTRDIRAVCLVDIRP
jgi:hypothetical protein